MTERKKGWKWWQKSGLGLALVLLILLLAFMSFRRPWIEPLPNVRMELDCPTVPEEDLGPESGYQMLCRALLSPPVGVPGLGGPLSGWQDALVKLRTQPWPESVKPETAVSSRVSGSSPVVLSVGDSSAPWRAEECSSFVLFVEAFRPKIALVDQALAAPLPPLLIPGRLDELTVSYDPAEALSLTRFLVLSAQFRAATGDADGALGDLRRLCYMARTIGRNMSGQNNSDAHGMWCEACTSALYISTHNDVPTRTLRDTARCILDLDDSIPTLADVARVSSLLTARWLGGDGGPGGLIPASWVPGHTLADFHPIPARAFRWGFSALARLAGSTTAAMERNMAAYYQHAVAIAEAPYSARTVASYKLLVPRLYSRKEKLLLLLRVRDPVGYVLAGTDAEYDAEDHQFVVFCQATTRSTALLLAIKAYEQTTGHAPDTLDRLVPDYLPHIPDDPYGGKPFHYLKSNVPGLPSNAWAVYSVSENFADDGGMAHSVGETEDKWGVNPDLVWPSQPYPGPDAGSVTSE